MEPKRLQHIAEQIVDLESEIYFQKPTRRRHRAELAHLDRVIDEIQDNVNRSEDLTEQLFLTRLQQKAYHCRFEMLKRAAPRGLSHVYRQEGRRTATGFSA